MSRSRWRREEVGFIIENYETMTTEELCKALNRNRKSVNRKIELLRDEGLVGHRSQETVNRAYLQRTRGNTVDDTSTRRSKRRSKGKFPTENYEYEEV